MFDISTRGLAGMYHFLSLPAPGHQLQWVALKSTTTFAHEIRFPKLAEEEHAAYHVVFVATFMFECPSSDDILFNISSLPSSVKMLYIYLNSRTDLISILYTNDLLHRFCLLCANFHVIISTSWLKHIWKFVTHLHYKKFKHNNLF